MIRSKLSACQKLPLASVALFSLRAVKRLPRMQDVFERMSGEWADDDVAVVGHHHGRIEVVSGLVVCCYLSLRSWRRRGARPGAGERSPVPSGRNFPSRHRGTGRARFQSGVGIFAECFDGLSRRAPGPSTGRGSSSFRFQGPRIADAGSASAWAEGDEVGGSLLAPVGEFAPVGVDGFCRS